MLAVHSNQSVK